jgi:hypothetical protein
MADESIPLEQRPMMEFEVLSGKHHHTHRDGSVVTYKKGEVVKTSLNLMEFKNKFRRIYRQVAQVVVEEGKKMVEEVLQDAAKDLISNVLKNEEPKKEEEVKPEPKTANVKKK